MATQKPAWLVCSERLVRGKKRDLHGINYDSHFTDDRLSWKRQCSKPTNALDEHACFSARGPRRQTCVVFRYIEFTGIRGLPAIEINTDQVVL